MNPMIFLVFFVAGTPSLHAVTLCDVVEETVARNVSVHVPQEYSHETQNSDGELLLLKGGENHVELWMGVVQVQMARRLSQSDFQLLATKLERKKDTFSARFKASNQDHFEKLIHEALLENAFYEKNAKPIRAGRELVAFLKRGVYRGTPLKISFKTDGVRTTWEEIESWGRIATTLHDVKVRSPEHAQEIKDNIQSYRDELATESQQQTGQNILGHILDQGPNKDRSENLLNEAISRGVDETVRDPNAVEVRIEHFHLEPLVFKIERFRNSVRLRTARSGEIPSLSYLVEFLERVSDGQWSTYERVSSRPIGKF